MNQAFESSEPSLTKTPSESAVEMTELVLPNDTNILGNLLGGRMMHWMDIAGAMAATRHSNRVVATIAVDGLDFRHPVHVGEIVILRAKISWVGRTSMEVIVNAYAEDIKAGTCIHTNKAYFTFVALDDNQKPTPVPRLKPETPEEISEYQHGEERRARRIHAK